MKMSRQKVKRKYESSERVGINTLYPGRDPY